MHQQKKPRLSLRVEKEQNEGKIKSYKEAIAAT